MLQPAVARRVLRTRPVPGIREGLRAASLKIRGAVRAIKAKVLVDYVQLVFCWHVPVGAATASVVDTVRSGRVQLDAGSDHGGRVRYPVGQVICAWCIAVGC